MRLCPFERRELKALSVPLTSPGLPVRAGFGLHTFACVSTLHGSLWLGTLTFKRCPSIDPLCRSGECECVCVRVCVLVCVRSHPVRGYSNRMCEGG